jgi:N-acyl-phosphatidylethanolamine-hydrolysing phospholipase D
MNNKSILAMILAIGTKCWGAHQKQQQRCNQQADKQLGQFTEKRSLQQAENLFNKSTRLGWKYWRITFAFVISCTGSLAWAQVDSLPRIENIEGVWVKPGGNAVDTVGFKELLRWRRERKKPDAVALPVVATDRSVLLNDQANPQFTWIGHSTFLLQIGGFNILTDPHFSDRASPVSWAGPKRMTPVPFALDSLPPIDLVLISHDHYDHLDKPTVQQLFARQPQNPPKYLVPMGTAELLDDWGIADARNFNWWDSIKIENELAVLTIHFVPAQHWGKRTPWDTNTRLWGSWVIQYLPKLKNNAPLDSALTGANFENPFTGEPISGNTSAEESPMMKQIFFGGDFGWNQEYVEAIIRKFGKMHLSFLPIGAYEPRWFMKNQHINPQEAVTLHKMLQSELSIGMHWGTFILTDEPVLDPKEQLEKIMHEEKQKLGEIGEMRVVVHGFTENWYTLMGTKK